MTRRGLLKGATAAAALTSARLAWVDTGPQRLGGDDPDGMLEGMRYDRERAAWVLVGDPGAYETHGSYTSSPVAFHPDRRLRVSWRPRWTTPLEWSRDGGNPVLGSTPGTWDSTAVTTCSVVPLNDELRMFYGARDRGIGLAVSDRNAINHWVKRDQPLLQAGERGAFDAGGVLSPAVIPVSDTHWYMYYVGYDPTRVHRSIRVHQIGLAESRNHGETWSRVTTDPVIALGPEGSCDGATISSNSVLRLGSKWYCWYTGMSQIPYLASICLATSDDGIHWQKYPHNPVLSYNPYVETDAFMVATPHVLHEEGVFKMWYNAKGFGDGRGIGDYRICYAESIDGIRWERSGKRPVLGPSGVGWDSQMVEYPEVQVLGGTYYMWYSGDGYSSIGCAVGRPSTRVTIDARTGSSLVPGATWSEWTELAQPEGTDLAESRGYVQVRVRLETTDRSVSPMVQDLAFGSM